MKHFLILAATLAAMPAFSETCAAVPDRSADLSALVEAARAAPDQASGLAVSNDMWQIWAKAPDARAQELLDQGMARRELYDFDGAIEALDALVAYCPDYAEGYNQRAFVNFLRQDYEAALPDLARTLEITPQHVAALTGQALTLAALQRNAEAALALRAALDMNPWLGERAMLPALEAQEQEL